MKDGARFGKWRVLTAYPSRRRDRKALCVCSCGKRQYVARVDLLTARTNQCRQCWRKNAPRKTKRGTTCSVVSCARLYSVRGLCAMHYRRLWKTGSVELKPRARRIVAPGHLYCPRCRAEKPAVEFTKDRSTNTGRSAYCGRCSAAKQRLLRAQHPDKKRGHHYRALYGITVHDYERMLARQRGTCAICKEPPKRQRLSVDHCHKTKRVRGLLCGSCNPGLGSFRDRPDLLRMAAKYLTERRR